MDIMGFAKQSTVVHVWLWCIFLLSAIVVVTLQFLSLPLWPLTKRWYRNVNCFLIQFFWMQYTWLADFWSGSTFNVCARTEDLRFVGKENVLLVCNHRSDVDWIVIWQLAARFGLLSGGKALMKDELKYVPLMGWSFYLAEEIFVKRDFARDRELLLKQLRNVASFHFNTTTTIFCEGTRYTKEKYEKSQAFAKERGIPGLKHHLLPRTKGFATCIEAYRNKGWQIYDMTIAYEGGHTPSLSDLMRGKKYHCQAYIRRFPLDSVPSDSEKVTADFCYQLFQEKDEAYSYFLEHGTFEGYDPGRSLQNVPRPLYVLFIMIFWIIVIGLPILYYTYQALTAGSMLTRLLTVVLFFGVVLIAKYMFLQSNSNSRSSYGLK
ncbi:1-acyl-sn-glycerol-3-phosphate acyltransferase delta-like [Diadema antillarum]|uniref:1-acyl-sn-glycerol-3-phosphate acyltransferase delta-like n=1 Tax=Diadema antillarum TaxID=105358 RepID=UPI003A877019